MNQPMVRNSAEVRLKVHFGSGVFSGWGSIRVNFERNLGKEEFEVRIKFSFRGQES